jgi:hypothetical protein
MKMLPDAYVFGCLIADHMALGDFGDNKTIPQLIQLMWIGFTRFFTF